MQTRQPAADAMLSALMTVGRLMRQRQADDQLDPGMFWLLKTIAHKGPMRISDLATAVHLDVSTVSRHVAQVERTGLVARTADPADGRAQLVGITDDGQQLLDQAFQRRRDLLESTLSGWEPDDIVEFERLLGKFVSGISSRAPKDLS
ncbi:MAG TPA: MarR family winged helix-turn-helix transcriptional regulator [Microlunatus sp.]|nr:MarR family winged helix-turn-helix transcriptional regulator [Microlunatus sp.]